MLPKKKIKSLISELRNVKSEDLLSQVYKDVGSGYHLKHYPERQAFWDVCMQTKALDPFVNTLFDKYLDLVVKSMLAYKCTGWNSCVPLPFSFYALLQEFINSCLFLAPTQLSVTCCLH